MTEIYRDSCRACMSKDVPLQGIFQTEVNSVPISAMLTFISSLNIGPNDGLPDMICSTCFNSLLISYEFQQMCVNSDMQMRANLALLQAQSSLSGDGDVEEAPKPSSSNVIEAAEQQHRSYDRDEKNHQREEDLMNVRAIESTGELVLKSELFDDEEHDGDGSVSGMQVDQAIKDELSSEDESILKPDDAAEETRLSAAKRKTNQEQLQTLDNFMREHKDLAIEYCDRTAAGRLKMERTWYNLKEILNSLGPPHKSLNEWRRVWSRYKYRKKQKSAAIKSHSMEDKSYNMIQSIRENNQSSDSFKEKPAASSYVSNHSVAAIKLNVSLENGSKLNDSPIHQFKNQNEIVTTMISNSKHDFLSSSQTEWYYHRHIELLEESNQISKDHVRFLRDRDDEEVKLRREELQTKKIELEILKTANDLKRLELAYKKN